MSGGESPVDRVLDLLEGVESCGGGWVAQCPAHEDRTPSLSVGEGDDGRALIHCHAGCNASAVIAAIGLETKDLFENNGSDYSRRRQEIEAYDYIDEDGVRLYQVVRFFPKDFRQRRPDGRGGWIWKLGETTRVIYRLPQIMEAVALGKLVHVVEGERDVHAVEQAGGVATTNSGGAGKWKREHSEALRGARVRVVADNDSAGRAHARAVSESLEGIAESVEIVQAREGKDAADHLAAGFGLDDFDSIEAGEERSEDRPTILVRQELNAVTDEAIAALAARPDLGVYVRGRALVTVARDGSARDRWLRRPPGAAMIVRIELPRMLGMLDDAATWERSTRDGALRPMRPPEWVAKQVLGRLEWPYPYLEAVIEAPTLRSDGSVLTDPGWDDATGLLLDPMPGITWPAVPEEPTASDLTQSVGTLLDPVHEFPFVADSDKAAYVAAVLSLVGRHLIDGPVPGFPIRAPTPGTGKTLLADVIGIIGTGRVPAAMSMTYQTEEFRKRILALAVDGTPLVLLENVSGSLGSDVLAGALTATEWRDRILGRTEMVSAPLKAVWLMTGNNLGFRRTLGRRVVPIDLDANVETPEDRTGFRCADLRAHVRQNRPELVTAALTLLRAFHLAGRPPHGDVRMGSFEAWDDLVRSAVIWAGLDDPATTKEGKGRGRIRGQADDDLEGLITLLEALQRIYPDRESFTTAGVIKKARDNDALSDALDTTAGSKRGGSATTRSLGATLREHKDRPVGGLVLRRLKRAWMVEGKGD